MLLSHTIIFVMLHFIYIHIKFNITLQHDGRLMPFTKILFETKARSMSTIYQNSLFLQ